MKVYSTNRMRTDGGRASPNAGIDLHSGGAGSNVESAAPRSMRPPSTEHIAAEGNAPQAVFESGRYGDAQCIPFAFAVAGSLLALPRPLKSQRTLLIIVNDLAAGTMRVNFDNPAAAGIGVPIVAGGNLFMDTKVPQNDIWIFSPGGGIATITFMNVDITDPTRVLRANS